MTGLIITITVVAIYWAIGLKRLPLYYKRVDTYNSKEYPSLYKHDGMKTSAAWGSLILVVVWPYYEFCRWVEKTIIHTMTAEQRQQEEYEKAEKIVAEYTERKEREERAAFNRALRGEK